MAYPTEPKIEIDDLAPHTTLGGYHASWQEGTLIAHAWLEAVNEQPARGYMLETTYQTVSGRDPGPRQREQATRLTVKVREYMTRQMIDAGWQLTPIPGSGMGWQHKSRLKPQTQSPIERGDPVVPKQPARRVLHVEPHEGKRQFKTYSRTLAPTSVTFTCSHCHQEATHSQYPGRIPQYCEPCADIVKREKTRERVARLRAGQKAGREVQTPAPTATTDEDRKQILLRKRGDGTYRIHQVEVDRWTAEARSPLTRSKWIPLSDEKLRIRLFANIDEAFQAIETNRRDMEALHLEMEEYSKRNAN